MKRRSFLKAAAGLFVPTIIGQASIPMQSGDGAWLGRRHVAAGESEPPSPLGDPNIGGMWRTDTDLYLGTGAETNRVRCDSEAAPRGWHDQSPTGADYHVNTACNGPVVTANAINGKPSLTFPCGNIFTALFPVVFVPQPFARFLLLRLEPSPVGYIFESYLGGSNGWGGAYYTGADSGKQLQMSIGAAGPTASAPALNQWLVLSCVFDGAASSMEFNNLGTTVADAGNRDYTTLCLGTSPGGTAPGTFKLAAEIWSMSHPDATWYANHKAWLAWYGGLSI